MAMEFTEWSRQNPGGTRADWEEYLGRLARNAAQANARNAQPFPGPEAVIAAALDDGSDMGRTASMVAAVTSGLRAAGYAIVPAHQGTTLVYTRQQVSDAVNGAADLLPEHEYECEASIAQDDTANFIVNAALYLLDHPGADADEVIAAQYTDIVIREDDMDEGEEVPEKGSPRWNELVAERVRGWLEA